MGRSKKVVESVVESATEFTGQSPLSDAESANESQVEPGAESVTESKVESAAESAAAEALRVCLVVADSPVKAKMIADMMPEATFNCDRAGLAGASEALVKRPGWNLFVIRGSKAIAVVKG